MFGFRIWGLGGLWLCLGFRVSEISGSEASVLGFVVQQLGFRMWGLQVGLQGWGLRI